MPGSFEFIFCPIILSDKNYGQNIREEIALRLVELVKWPEGLYDVPAVLIQQVLPHPTLIHLPGRAPEPIFVSALLHGNEDVGLKAVQQLLIKYRGQVLPRSLSVFIGNVEAASAGVRYLPHQLDYNACVATCRAIYTSRGATLDA